MILHKFPSGPLETNAILFACAKTKKGAVIDPALGSAKILLQQAEEEGLVIEKILLTHSHWDHFADADSLKKATKAPLFVHFSDAKNVEHPGSDQIPFFFAVHPVKPDHFLKGGETLEVGTLKLEVIHTPGHSPGGVCFYLQSQKVLFSGDTLFRGSIGNLQLPTAQPTQMWHSLEKLAQLPPETRVIPGHGEDTTIGEEKWLQRAREIFS